MYGKNRKSISTISLQTLTFSSSACHHGQILLRVGECPEGGTGQVENFGYQFMGYLRHTIPHKPIFYYKFRAPFLLWTEKTLQVKS